MREVTSAPVAITPAVAAYLSRSLTTKPLGLLRQCGWQIGNTYAVYGATL